MIPVFRFRIYNTHTSLCLSHSKGHAPETDSGQDPDRKNEREACHPHRHTTDRSKMDGQGLESSCQLYRSLTAKQGVMRGALLGPQL